MSDATEKLVHGTCVAIGDWCVLFRGDPGSGKSDLGLRLIEDGAALVSDDQVALTNLGDYLVAGPPGPIAGLLEVRGVGILRKPHVSGIPLAMLVDLVPAAKVPRLPDARTDNILNVELPVIDLYAFETSAAIKVRLALQSLLD